MFSLIFIDFQLKFQCFSMIFIDLHWFSMVSMALNGFRSKNGGGMEQVSAASRDIV